MLPVDATARVVSVRSCNTLLSVALTGTSTRSQKPNLRSRFISNFRPFNASVGLSLSVRSPFGTMLIRDTHHNTHNTNNTRHKGKGRSIRTERTLPLIVWILRSTLGTLLGDEWTVRPACCTSSWGVIFFIAPSPSMYRSVTWNPSFVTAVICLLTAASNTPAVLPFNGSARVWPNGSMTEAKKGMSSTKNKSLCIDCLRTIDLGTTLSAKVTGAWCFDFPLRIGTDGPYMCLARYKSVLVTSRFVIEPWDIASWTSWSEANARLRWSLMASAAFFTSCFE